MRRVRPHRHLTDGCSQSPIKRALADPRVGNEHHGKTNKGGISWELNRVQKERLHRQENLIGAKEIIK